MSVKFKLNALSGILSKRGLGMGGKVQRFIGSEVKRRCDKYVPLAAGPLKNTVQVLENGREVRYVQIYAKKQYYSSRRPGSSTGALRGPKWFERMKAAEGSEIITGAANLAGGRSTR